MNLDIAGDAAVVTASSSGLGKAAATALAREGVNVVINGRHEDRLQSAAEEIRETATGTVVPQAGDLTVADDIDRLIHTAVDEFGRLDHLVTSAGGPPSGAFLELSDDDWYRTFDLLVMSVVRCVREAAPYLRDGGGTITTIASTSVKEALDTLVLSNSVRMSVVGLEKTLSRELAPDVRVNAVLPGGHETDRTKELATRAVEREEYESYDEWLAEFHADVPLERIGDPMELGNAVAFLCSERAGFINGVAVPVDGGALRSNL